MNSKQALSEWLIRRAAAVAAAKPEITDQDREPAAAPAPPFFIDEFLWGKLFDIKPEHSQPDPEPAHDPLTLPDLAIPAGFHDSSALDRLIEQNALFSGLVVSIGISPLNPASGNSPETVGTIQNFLLSLMRLNDFGCREKDDRFLLICPDRTGVDARQHLNSLSERLWDFQLRSLDPAPNDAPFLLSVGALDVEREPLGDAVASACERMIQTQRSRIAIASLTLRQLRKAV